MEDNLNPVIIPDEKPEFIPKPEIVPPIPLGVEDFTARGREFAFGGAILLLSVLMVNFVLFGGFHLGFALAAMGSIVCTWLYLKRSGHKFGRYEKTLLILSLVIAAGFGRSDDGFVKFVMLLFLFAAVNLAFGLAAGQNRRDPNGAGSLLDAPRVFYRLGVGSTIKSGSGLVTGFKQGGESTRRIGAVGVGLLVSVPVLGMMISLLMSADAAFEGLMDLLPEIDTEEYILSGCWGAVLGWILYSRGLGLNNTLNLGKEKKTRQGIHPLTVNTVLIMVCVLYLTYLISQLAYLSGGLSGILPEEFTMAEYARRGFFEMAWLCAINLCLLCLVMALIRAEGKLPLLTRIAGTFLGAVTVFLVITASAKMFLYIGSYGLTRLRVLTEVIMLWLAITTVIITVRLYARKMPYMKAVMLTAMVLGTLVFWVDVNTLVAGYNMNAYRTGKLETIDVWHMGQLGAPGVQYLVELTEDKDPLVAEQARDLLNDWDYEWEDFRDWNYSQAQATKVQKEYRDAETAAVRAYLSEQLGIELDMGSVMFSRVHTFVPENGERFLRLSFTPEEAEILEPMLNKAEWAKLPILTNVRTLITGNKSLFGEYAAYYSTPDHQDGWWLFRDLHPDGSAEKPLHSRDGSKFVLAWYNADSRRLYFFEADTLALPEK